MRKSLLLAALAVAAFAAPASAGAATPGLNVSQFSELSAAQATGVKLTRIFLSYPSAAPTAPSSDDYIQYDQVINGYSAAGIKPILVVSGSGAPPSSISSYASYVADLAGRYSGKIAAIEVWNEPDEKIWWGNSGGDPATYASLLKASYSAVAGRATVIMGGLTGNNYNFLEKVYQNLGGSSAGAFDAVSTHTDTACSIVGPDSFYRNPDGQISEFSFLGIRSVRDTMVKYGDSGKKIWITELGWSTTGQTCASGLFAGKKAGGVSEADQAKFLGQAYHCLKSYDYVENALWFNLRDPADDIAEHRFGLERPDGAAKPSLQAFQDVVAGKDAFDGQPCGDFDPPAITISSPTEYGIFFDVLPISVSATDPSGVGRISLAADGKLIRNFTTGKTSPLDFPKTLPAAITWQGSKQLAYGNHTLTVTALDGNGNATSKTLHIVKADPSKIKNVKTAFKPLKLTGKGAKRSLKVQVTAPTTGVLGFRATHKVLVTFQKKVKGKWKTAHKYTKTAKKPFTLKVTLAKATWRVQATFAAKAPFKASKTPWLQFKV